MSTTAPTLRTAADIADWYLDRAERAGLGVTPMKLLKLVYLAQGWHLAHTDRLLFNDRIEASLDLSGPDLAKVIASELRRRLIDSDSVGEWVRGLYAIGSIHNHGNSPDAIDSFR